MDIKKIYNAFLNSNGISTDTRTLKKGELFFALNGPNFNGNHFAKNALEKGASFVVVDNNDSIDLSSKVLVVNNSLKTLQDLATYHRKKINTPIIAITGSNGKTTTKELIREVLSKSYEVLATEGNLNNNIGVPLTLLRLKKKHEIGIIEMGANHLDEIESLCYISLPNWGYITNFGKAHLEGFGSKEGVIKGKSELYKHLKLKKGQILINADDPEQIKQTRDQKVIRFGSNEINDIKISYTSNNKNIQVQFKGLNFESPLYGDYNLTNIAASIAFGVIFKVDLIDIKNAIEGYKSKNNRSQKLIINNVPYILDAYNANPSSMQAALNAFAENQAETKSVILGDMLELGSYTKNEHENILNLCLKLNFKEVFTIGNNFKSISINSNKIFRFEKIDTFKEYFKKNNIVFDSVLIKGSRFLQLENLIPFFKSR
ncbi:MAG: UDP-N-acetylmuramoyl-tripeptide--D-alanyl-D-alanine ligase [Flavobacteriaceae bacterium]